MRLLILTLVCAVLAAAATAAASAAPRVTVISDSVLTSVTWHDDNMAILDDGFDMDVHVAICRRLAVPGCVSDGEAPPSLFDVLAGLPDVAPTVVVEMGYNDDPARFQADVEETIARLTARGAARIVWPTLSVMPSAFQSEFQAKNDILVQSYNNSGPVFEARVCLIPDATNKTNGFKWSSSAGPDRKFSSVVDNLYSYEKGGWEGPPSSSAQAPAGQRE